MKNKILLFVFLLTFSFSYSQIDLIENFDASTNLPTGWTSSGYSGTSQASCSGNSFRDNLWSSSTSGNLTSPNIIGLSNATDLNLSFDYKVVEFSSTTTGTAAGWGEIIVQYSTDNGTTWINATTINDSNHVVSGNCATISQTIPAANLPTGSDFKLQFVGNYTTGDYYIYFDNISALQASTTPPNCDANLVSPADGATSAPVDGNITWTAATGIPFNYTLNVGTTPGGTDILNNISVGNVTSYALGTLNYSTTYYITITPSNSNGDATGCTEQSFTTIVDPSPQAPVGVSCGTGNSSFIFTESFETDPPSGWTGNSFDGSNGNWDITTGNANSTGTGPFSSQDGNMHLEYEASGNSTAIANAISPAIDLSSAVDGAELSFYMHAFGADIGTLNVGVSTSATGTFTTLYSYTLGQLQTSDTDAWIPVGINLDAYLGQIVYIQFSYGATGGGWEGDMSIDYIQVETCGDFCIAPSGITASAITDTSATIGWTANSGESAWEYVVQPAGTGIPSTGTATTTNPVNVTGLTSSTSYEVYVRANCGNGLFSIWTGPFNFTTLNTPPPPPVGVNCSSGTSTFIFTESFETDPPSGWTGNSFDGSNGNWDITTGNANSTGTGPFASQDGNMHLEYEASGNSSTIANAISPLIDLTTAVDGAELSFYMHAFGADMGTLNVGVSNSATGPFTTVYTWIGDYQTSDSEAWVPIGVNLDAYLGQTIYLQFSYGGAGTGFKGDMSIDFVRVEACGSFCIAPSNLSVTNITGTTADFSWTANNGETSWEYVIQPIGTGVPTTGTVTSTNPLNLTGLNYSTDYEIYIRAICDAATNSIWAGPINFLTTIQTNFTVDCSAGPINTTYCYSNNDTTAFVYQSSTGFPLNLSFNSGTVENNFDELIILDSDGSQLYNGYGTAGDLTGLSFLSTGDTITIMISSDSSVSCSDSTMISWDFDVWCQTCITQTVDFNIVGDCDQNQFSVEVNVTDMGDASSLTLSDNQGSPDQVVTSLQTVTFGPYAPNSNIIITVANTNDANCIVTSDMLTFLCPPPPNECSIIFAGDDVTLACNETNVDLTSSFMTAGVDPNVYNINTLSNCPTPPVTGGNPTGIDLDDRWSPIIDLNFDFCFFGNTYNQVVVDANGAITFDTTQANQPSGWVIGAGDLLPTTNMHLNTIFGAYHDLDISSSQNTGTIEYISLGSAPNRQFVVNYNNVDHFSSSCDVTTTQQIILYESSNNIDINIFDKPACTTWNGGRAIVGIQNDSGTIAFTPTNRNTGVFDITNEFYRFSPGGSDAFTFEWFDGTTSLGNAQTITVSPTVETTYTASITYTLCDGSTATITDDVTVTPSIITADILTDENACDQFTLPALSVNNNFYTGSGGTGTQLNEGDIITTTQTIYIYAVSPTDPTCTDESSFTVTIHPSPTADILTDENACDQFTLPALSVNNNFYTGPGGTGTLLNEGDIITTTQTIYIYAVSPTDPTCTDESSFTVTINPSPTADILTDDNACNQYSLPALSINNNFYTGPGGTGTQLNEGDIITTTQTIYIYAVSATNPTCTDESNFTITIHPLPTINSVSNIEACGNTVGMGEFDTTDVESQVIGTQTGLTVTYEDADGNPLPSPLPNPMTSAEQTITVIVTTSNNCSSTTTFDLVLKAQSDCSLIFPEGFSPDGDGINDTFEIGNLTTLYPQYTIEIFNRWGKNVFNGNINTGDWNGKKDGTGELVPVGVYYYIINPHDPNKKPIQDRLYISR